LLQSMMSARGYLERMVADLDDSYDVAIATYALHLTNSSHSESAFTHLMSKSIQDSLTRHWERPKPANQPTYYYWQRKTDAINIEMTAYALLTLLHRDDVTQALPLVRWLTMQRGPQGGFISTQDTVVGLQGLAQIAAAIYQPHFSPIKVKVEYMSGDNLHTEHMTLNESTKQLLQTLRLPMDPLNPPTEVTIIAEPVEPGNFSGIAVAEVNLDYFMEANIARATSTKALSKYTLTMEPVALDKDGNFFLELTARQNGSGSMTMVEVGMPSGYTVDDTHVKWDVAGASQAEFEGNKYILYYDVFGEEAKHIVLPVTITDGNPIRTRASAIRMYDYYENTGCDELVVEYELPKPKSICDRQPDFETCSFRTKTGY